MDKYSRYKIGSKTKKTPEYKAWQGMKDRCYNPNSHKWEHYGGRGITVCDRWKNSYENFVDDMGLKPSQKLSLDRINNDGDYSPDNCRWTDTSTQNSNKRHFAGMRKTATGYVFDEYRGISIVKNKNSIRYIVHLGDVLVGSTRDYEEAISMKLSYFYSK